MGARSVHIRLNYILKSLTILLLMLLGINTILDLYAYPKQLDREGFKGNYEGDNGLTQCGSFTNCRFKIEYDSESDTSVVTSLAGSESYKRRSWSFHHATLSGSGWATNWSGKSGWWEPHEIKRTDRYVSLPQNFENDLGTSHSPIPRLTWREPTFVKVYSNETKKCGIFRVADNGPALWTGNAIDMTLQAQQDIGMEGDGQVQFQILTLNILSPSKSKPAFGGTKARPHVFELKIIFLKDPPGFRIKNLSHEIKIGGQKARVISTEYFQSNISCQVEYTLRVEPPALEDGVYNLEVKFDYDIVEDGGQSQEIHVTENDIEYDAVRYGTTTKPLDIILDTDCSGSMAGQKIIDAKGAAKLFLSIMEQQSKGQDKVGLVSFSSSATLDLSLRHSDFKTAKDKIDAYSAGGFTNMWDALSKSIEELEKYGRSDAIRSIIYFTDGITNTGPGCTESEDRCKEEVMTLVRKASEKGIIIYTLGYGSDVDKPFLEQVAKATGGNYYFAPDAAKLMEIYTELSQKTKGIEKIAEFKGVVRQGERKRETFLLKAKTLFMKFFLLWPGSDLDLAIIDPQGNRVVPGPSVTYSGNDAFPEYYEIYEPAPGNWIIEVYGKAVTGASENYTIIVFQPEALMQVRPSEWEIDYPANKTKTFTVSEIAGMVNLEDVTFTASDLVEAKTGSRLPASSFSFSPNDFTIPAGATQEVQAALTIPPGTANGVYLGTITVTSSTRSFTITVRAMVKDVARVIIESKKGIPIGSETAVKVSVADMPHGGLKDLQVGPRTGKLTFNPSIVEIVTTVGTNGFTGLGGFSDGQPFQVWAANVDNAKGQVFFVAAKMGTGIVNGDILTVTFRCKAQGTSPIDITGFDVLRADDGTDIIADIIPGSITCGPSASTSTDVSPQLAGIVVSSPVKNGEPVSFTVNGQGISETRVQVYNLLGRAVYDSGFTAGERIIWRVNYSESLPLANGVYLYIVTVRGHDGQIIQSKVSKLVILR